MLGGTRGSGVSIADDVLEMSVVGEMCMCLARGGMSGGERIGFGIYESCRNMGSMVRVSVFGLRAVRGRGWVLGTGSGRVGWILCVD